MTDGGVTAQELRDFDISLLKKEEEKLLWRSYLKADLERSKAPAVEKWMKTCVAYVNMGDRTSLPDAPTFSQTVLQNASQSSGRGSYVAKGGKGSGRGQSGKGGNKGGGKGDYETARRERELAERERERKEAERREMERQREAEERREAERQAAQRKWEEEKKRREAEEWEEWHQTQQKQEWREPEKKWTEEPQYTPEEWAAWEEEQKRKRGGGGGGGGGASNPSNSGYAPAASPKQSHAKLCPLCNNDTPYCSKTGHPHTNSTKQANPERFMYGLIPTIEGHCVHLLDVVDESTGNLQGMKVKLTRSYYK